MQGAKAGRLLGGRTLLERAMAQAAGYSPLVALSVRTPGQSLAGAVPVLTDDPDLPGPLAGVASALRFAEETAAQTVLTIPVDAPFLPADLADRLRAALAEDIGVALARSGGQLHPVCALWRAGLDDQLRAYADTGRGALMGLADAVGWAAVEWPTQPVDPFFNVNTPQDLARAEALFGASPTPPPRP